MRRNLLDHKADAEEYEQYRGGLGGVGWVTNTRSDLSHESSVLASRVPDLRIRDVVALNKTIRKAKKHASRGIVYRKLEEPRRTIFFSDSNHDPTGEKIYGGTYVFVGGPPKHIKDKAITKPEDYETAEFEANTLAFSSKKAQRTTISIFSAETHQAVNGYDLGRHLQWLFWFLAGNSVTPRLEWPSLLRSRTIPGVPGIILFTDCQSLVDFIISQRGNPSEKRLIGYLEVLRESVELKEIAALLQCETKRQLADHLTKIMDSATRDQFMKTGVICTKPAKYNRAQARKEREEERQREVARRQALGIKTEKSMVVVEWLSKALEKMGLTKDDLTFVDFEDDTYSGVGQLE